MENLALKVKLAVLWVILAEAVSAYYVLSFMMPGLIEQIIAGEIEGVQITAGVTSVVALLWLIPLPMAVLSLTLKDSTNRWANRIVGIAYVAFYILDLSNQLINVQFGGHTLMVVSKFVVAVLIAWYAWRWPRQEVVTKPKE